LVWNYARERGYTIVTKDSEFQERSQVARSRPSVVWVRRGNSSTADIEAMLRKHADAIGLLGREQAGEFLVLL
jgi:predicted nuclease of predicted toxin-antitoxin system